MPRKRIRSKRKNDGQVSPMMKLILRGAISNYERDPNDGTRKVLQTYLLKCGIDPEEYFNSRQRGRIFQFAERG